MGIHAFRARTRVPLYGYVLCLILVILMLIPYDSGLQKTIEHKGKKRFWGHFCTVSGRVEGETQFTERRWFYPSLAAKPSFASALRAVDMTLRAWVTCARSRVMSGGFWGGAKPPPS